MITIIIVIVIIVILMIIVILLRESGQRDPKGLGHIYIYICEGQCTATVLRLGACHGARAVSNLDPINAWVRCSGLCLYVVLV